MFSNNPYFESREELLSELQEASVELPRYADEDDAVTRFFQGPLDEPEWLVVVAAHDRRMLSTSQLSAGLRSGELTPQMLAWRSGMSGWSPIAAIAELARVEVPRVEATCAEPIRVDPIPVDAAPPTRVKQVVMGLSALIMFGVFLTMFAISSARDNTEQRGRSRGEPLAIPATRATSDESSDPPPTAAALLSEADREDGVESRN